MNIILATRNPSKKQQIKQFFESSGITILGLDEVGIDGDVIEDGQTLQENALKKARFAAGRVANVWTMADDTGIFITALNGAPGIRSARWMGETATTEQGTQFVVDRMKGIADRSAIFRTVAVLISPEGKEYSFVGEVSGHLLEAPRVPPQPKMPYSALFVPDGEDKVWAEMSVEYENLISHRGKAFRRVREFLEGREKE
jgi:XTP/dITP diphosphohydrolase